MAHGSHSRRVKLGDVLVLLNDIIVFSKTWDKHLQRLEGVYEHLRNAKRKLGASKCTMAAL